jgi:hypothetical protein
MRRGRLCVRGLTQYGHYTIQRSVWKLRFLQPTSETANGNIAANPKCNRK